MTKTAARHPDWWVPFRNPYETLRELDEVCRVRGAASGWKATGKMPWWVELVLAQIGTVAPISIQTSVAYINDYLANQKNCRLEEIVGGDYQSIRIVKVIAG